MSVWSLLSAWVVSGLVMPVLYLLVARSTGVPIRRMSFGTGPPLRRWFLGDLVVQLGALPFGSWLAGEEDGEPLPAWFLVVPHTAFLLGTSLLAAAVGPDLWLAALRGLAGLVWLAPLAPFPGWSRLWALDAAHPLAAVATALSLLSLANVVLAVLQVVGRSQPPLGCGFGVVWALVLARACAWTVR